MRLAASSLSAWLVAFAAADASPAAQPVSPPATLDVPAPAGASRVTEAEFLEAPGAAAGLDEALRLQQADRLAVGRLLDPTLSIVHEAVDTEQETEVSIGWRPPRPDRRRLALAAADARVDAAEAGYRGRLLALRLELKAVYAEWAIQSARVGHLETEAQRFERLARRAQARADAGEASGWEARRLRLAASDASARAALARVDSLRAAAQVRAWRPDLGDHVVPELPSLNALDPAESRSPESGPTTTLQTAALRAELTAAELETRLASKVARLPEFEVGWRRVAEDARIPGLRDESADGFTVGLSWAVPTARRAERLEATARRDALGARLARLEAHQAAEIAGVLAAARDLRQALEAATAVLADVEPSLHAATVAFDLGERDLGALVETIQAATATHLTHLDLLQRALALDRDLERLRSPTEGLSP